MADLKYYVDERYRHPEACISARPETYQACCEFLFRCCKVPYIPVYNRLSSPPPGKRPTKNGTSFFEADVTNPFISLCGGATLLTICHEVAHYVHYCEQMAVAKAAGKTRPDKWERWHGERHAKIVSQLVPMMRMAYPHIRRECGVA